MSPSFVSRRTWLWASTTAFAAACARPEPSKLPDGGPEPARPLTRRGAENLTALAELGAAIRWMHPSDQVIETEWEPLLLDGVRGIESAATSVELREGLLGLMVGVAPTLLLWRGGESDEDEAMLDALACEEPSDEKAEEKADKPTPSEASRPATEDRARPAEAVRHHERSGPPTRKAPGAPSDRKQAEDAAKAKADAKDDETGGDETAGDETGGDDDETETSSSETGQTSEPEPEPVKAEPAPKPEPAKSEPASTKPEPRPPLPAELFEEGADLEITQWHRRGFSEGLDAQLGCAQRIRRTPTSCGSHNHKKDETACSRCEGEGHHALAPGAPAQLDLPRALTAAMPVALWTRSGRTLPASAPLAPAPAFDERRAWDYDLADRGTRLLAVIRAHSLLRSFHAHREHIQDPRELLRTAMCAVADDDSPLVLQETLERMLASFGDGQAELHVEFGKPARRWTPELSLRWIEERVVVGVTLSEHARAGDVITAIDGVPIDELLARELGRTPAARPGTAIERTVARLLTRRDKGTKIEIDALRADNDEEQHVSSSTTAIRRAEGSRITDARPSKPIFELREGMWYVDATRVPRLDAVARRLRRAKGVIVDLRGQLADPSGSLCAHLLDNPLAVAHERTLAGPDERGELSLASIGTLELEPRRPRLRRRVVALADSRTRGRAEFELLAFDRLGVPIVGSASAGDLGEVTQAWLPGGWRLSFTTSEVRQHDGSSLWGQGVRASVPVEETVASVRAGEDLLLRTAQEQLS